MGWLACVSVRIKNIQANSEKSYQDNVKIYIPPWLVGKIDFNSGYTQEFGWAVSDRDVGQSSSQIIILGWSKLPVFYSGTQCGFKKDRKKLFCFHKTI